MVQNTIVKVRSKTCHATFWLEETGEPGLYGMHVYPGDIESITPSKTADPRPAATEWLVRSLRVGEWVGTGGWCPLEVLVQSGVDGPRRVLPTGTIPFCRVTSSTASSFHATPGVDREKRTSRL